MKALIVLYVRLIYVVMQVVTFLGENAAETGRPHARADSTLVLHVQQLE